MRIRDILHQDMVLAELDAPNKDAVLRQLAAQVAKHPAVSAGADLVYTALSNRERLGSTGVGEGVAIPHAKIAGLTHLVACFARSSNGIVFDAIDQKLVQLFFVLLVPENSAGAHLKALARVSRLLRSPEFRQRLLDQPDGSALYDAFITEDAGH